MATDLCAVVPQPIRGEHSAAQGLPALLAEIPPRTALKLPPTDAAGCASDIGDPKVSALSAR